LVDGSPGGSHVTHFWNMQQLAVAARAFCDHVKPLCHNVDVAYRPTGSSGKKCELTGEGIRVAARGVLRSAITRSPAQGGNLADW
jgi:hypothetical protein